MICLGPQTSTPCRDLYEDRGPRCRQQDGQFKGWAELRAEGFRHQSGDPGVVSHSPEVLETHQMLLSETGLPKVKVSFVHRDCAPPQATNHHSTAWTSAAWTLDSVP